MLRRVPVSKIPLERSESAQPTNCPDESQPTKIAMKTPNPNPPIRNALKHLALVSTLGAAMYFGASPASAAPPVTTGLTLHLDASQITGLSDGNTVNTWTDVSGSVPANNATTSAGTPIYKTGILNGQPVVRFDNNSALQTADLSAQFPSAATSFIVTTIDNDNAYTLVKANPGVDEWWRYDGNGNSYPGFFRGDRLESYCAMPNSGSQLFAISSSATAWEMSINGVSQGVVGANYNAGGALVIGNGSTGGGLNGDIAEVILYNRILDSSELLAVGGYLTAKYGLTTTYPTGLTVGLTSPANNQAYRSGTSISATATVVSGTAPYTVKFFTRSLPGGTFAQAGADLTTSPYKRTLGALSNGSYEIYATVTDSAGPPVTATSATNTFTVAPAISTTTTVASSGSPLIYGDSVTFTATVSPIPSGGTVRFRNGGNSLGTPVAVTAGKATYTTNTLGATTHVITADYSGYQTYQPSTTAASISQLVNKAGLTVTAQNAYRFPNTANPNPLPYEITGFQNGENLATSGVGGTPALSTTAALLSPVGNYPITCAVGTLAAPNYRFTSFVGATLTVVDPATPLAINVNIDDTVRTGLVGPDGGLGAVWNTIAADSATNLRHASGPATTVGFTSSGTGGWFFGTTADPNPLNLSMFTHGWINFSEPNTQQLVINGLDPAKTYDLYIASAILIDTNQRSQGVWSTPNLTSSLGDQVCDNRFDQNGTSWVRGNNYVLFEDVEPDVSGNITVNGSAITEQPTYDIRLPINGFQIRLAGSTPEFRWKGVVGGNWTDVANWNNTVPGAADIAILSDSGTAGQTLTLDAHAAVAGLTFNNLVANQVIASPAGKTLTLATVPTSRAELTVEGTHSISANVDISSGTKLGSGTVDLSGTVAAHQRAGSASDIAMFVSDGVLSISGTSTFDPGTRMRVDGSGTLEVTGVLNTAGTLFPVGSGDSTATATVILKGSGRWNQTHTTGGDVAIGISGDNNGRLVIQDTAQLNTAFMALGLFGPCAGTVQQNGGTVTLVTTPADYSLGRPALMIGGSGPGDYHLNSGTLTCGSIGGSGKLYFNGGRLVANMDDLIMVDPGGALSATVGQTSFMQGLNQVVVQSGAVIDTAGRIITIAQDLEHDSSGPAIDGGLTKQGLGTLKLLQASSYTGPTKVQGGTLACETVASVAPTALEIGAAAKVDLTYAGSQTIPSLKIGVNVKGPGVYGSSSSPAPLANRDDVHFAGTGTVTVGGSTAFNDWASTNGASGQTPDQDHDKDGVQNGIEYFMGETGSSMTAMPGLDATNTVSWPMSPTYNGTYEVQTSPNLGNWTNVVPRPLPSGGKLSYTLPRGAPGGKRFVRLLVTPTP